MALLRCPKVLIQRREPVPPRTKAAGPSASYLAFDHTAAPGGGMARAEVMVTANPES